MPASCRILCRDIILTNYIRIQNENLVGFFLIINQPQFLLRWACIATFSPIGVSYRNQLSFGLGELTIGRNEIMITSCSVLFETDTVVSKRRIILHDRVRS